MTPTPSKIRFQFDDAFKDGNPVNHQGHAIKSIVDLFDGLPKKTGDIYAQYKRQRSQLQLNESDPVRNIEISTGHRLLENLRSIQLDNGLFPDERVLDGNNFTVEMETGTGKTYVYLRTILELHQKYDFKKFMIVVPSIAIRIGVIKSIEMLTDHFKATYNINIAKHSFVYDGDINTVRANLVESNDLSICVLNIQAFNKTTNKMRSAKEGEDILWDEIQYIRPIVIIDEPQKIEGGTKSKSKTLQAIEEVNPLFILRYSATHKNLYNQVYKLNSHEAYKQQLVKQIEVRTVNGIIPKDFAYIRYLDFTSDLYARIEIFTQKQGGSIRFETFKVRGNASIFDLSGGLPQYRDFRIAGDPHKHKPLIINTPAESIKLNIGRSTYEITENEAIRVQIRLAIESHFRKQDEILQKGKKIKVLTLFFVDSVAKVRDKTASGWSGSSSPARPCNQDGRGEYLRIFDEEYEKHVTGQKFKKMFQQHSGQMSFLTLPDQINKVREGYFAVDKKQNIVEIDDWDASVADEDSKVKAKSQEDIDRGIELILQKKDELISFDEPLSFIFSHSALREGWDNPNVFTICTLKHGGSEIAKKQEIGRGLRLPVDTNGVRCTDSNINQLTVIANDSFAHFADRLQKDFNDSMSFKKDEVTPEILTAALKNAGVPKDKITSQLIDTLRDELFLANIINAQNMLTKDARKIDENLTFSNPTLQEHAFNIVQKFKEVMVDKGTSKITITNGDNEVEPNGPHPYVNEADFKAMLDSLSAKLQKRTIYKLNLDKEAFITDCITELNDVLRNRKIKSTYEITTAGVTAEESGRFGITSTKTRTVESRVEDEILQRSDFELANTIMYHTSLPRFAIFRILQGIEKKILLSNQDILDMAVKLINAKLKEAKAKSVQSYEVINGCELNDKLIFEADTIHDALREEVDYYRSKPNSRRAVNKFYRTDSDGEYNFADSLDDLENENILLYTKLKKGGFVIDTPYGNYSPDWAIVCKNDNDELRLYFIVETKFEYERLSQLPPEQQDKIKFGSMHFKAVAEHMNSNVKFLWASSFERFKENAGIS